MEEAVTKKRPLAAAKMRKKILETASELFLKKGFDGVSISEIVKMAKINQSLIYHYFESKEHLWKEVKNYLIEDYAACVQPSLDSSLGLKGVLEQIVYTRHDIYAKNPNILRLMSWQRLQTPQENLTGGTLFSPNTWKPILLQLQQQGSIRKEVDVDVMILFIISAVSGSYMEEFRDTLSSPEKTNAYLDMVIESCLVLFGNLKK